MSKLSPKQQRFVQAYIKCDNAEQAVILAGYMGENTQRIRHRAEVLLANPYIQQEIERQKYMLECEPIIREWYELQHGGGGQR